MPDSGSAVETCPVKTEIVAVTVYPDQARVTRRGQVTVQPPQITLDIGPLPATLTPPSIQAHAQGTAQVILQKPTLKSWVPDDERQQQEQDLSDRLRHIEDQFRQCKDQLAGLQHQQSFLESLAERTARTFAQGLAQQAATLDNITAFVHYFEQAYQQNSEAIARQERHKHDLDQQLQQARQTLQQFQANGQTSQYHILLPLTVQQAGTLELSIIYDVTEAQWQSAYDVRLQADQPSLQIDCIAEVQQNTGEDWPQVELKVSTAMPDKTPAIPDASLLHAQSSLRPQPAAPAAPPRTQLKSRSPVLDDTYRMLGAVPGSEIPPQAEDEGLGDAMFQPANAIIRFVAPQAVQVLSGGEVHRVPVGQLQLDSHLTYVALPQRCGAAYLCAALTNPPDKWPLLPGTAYLFRNGGYIGAEKFDYVAPGASFRLSLGLDEQVAVQRELVTQTAVSDQLGSDLRAYRLTLHNPFDHAIEVTVVEQLPMSRSEDIEVQLTHAQPAATPDENGQCQWLIQLAPQAAQQIAYQYEIQYPPEGELANLGVRR